MQNLHNLALKCHTQIYQCSCDILYVSTTVSICLSQPLVEEVEEEENKQKKFLVYVRNTDVLNVLCVLRA